MPGGRDRPLGLSSNVSSALPFFPIEIMRTKDFILAMALITAMAIVVSTGQAESSPQVAQILERYTRALGGEALARGLVSIIAEGSFYVPESQIRGMVRQALKAPNKSIYTIRSQDGEIFMELGFDGRIGWQQRLYSGGGAEVRQITGPALKQMQLNADLYREFKLPDLYPRMRYRGWVKIAGQPAEVIEAVSVGGQSETWYFDRQTGLLRRRDSWSVSAGESVRVQNYFADYREVSGVMIPYEVRACFPDSPENNIVITIHSITVNSPVSDSRFIMPRW
jgi:zinc protease